MFTDEKPMKGCDIYNRKIRCSPLDGLVPFVDTGFDIRNKYNLMAAIKLHNDNKYSRGRDDIHYQRKTWTKRSKRMQVFLKSL